MGLSPPAVTIVIPAGGFVSPPAPVVSMLAFVILSAFMTLFAIRLIDRWRLGMRRKRMTGLAAIAGITPFLAIEVVIPPLRDGLSMLQAGAVAWLVILVRAAIGLAICGPLAWLTTPGWDDRYDVEPFQ